MDLGATVDAIEAALRETWHDHDVRVFPSGTRTCGTPRRYVQEWTARGTTPAGDTVFSASAVGDDSAAALANLARTLRVRT